MRWEEVEVTIRAFSLFSGCGGCSLGLTQAGIEVALAADISDDACATYAVNLGETNVWNGIDLAAVDAQSLLSRAQIGTDDVGLIVGGPPCQGFSSAGARDWADPRNALVRHFVELVTELQPTWFIMENVEGLLTASDGFFFIEAVARFLAAGYWVRVKKIYMGNYGVPQKRKRVIVVGNLEQCPFDFPRHTHGQQLSLFASDEHPLRTLNDAIGDMPTAATTKGTVFYDRSAESVYQAMMRRTDGNPVTHHESKRITGIMRQRIEQLPPGGTMKSLPQELQHPSYHRRAFRRVMDGTPTERRGGAPSGLKRLVGETPALTITSASPSEFVHPVENRLLTLRECARIQSFPDCFEFCGSYTSIATQIGNAIPPLFMKQLALHIRSVARWQKSTAQYGRWLGIEATKSAGMSPALTRMLDHLQARTVDYVG